jgi:glycosyltransferase involved in cell wall biosynthesis
MIFRKHILLIEAQNQGHHPAFISVLGDMMLSQGYLFTLAMPKNENSLNNLLSVGCHWLNKVEWVDWTAGEGWPMLDAASRLLRELKADEVFFACFDEVASALLRRAAMGFRPPKNLRGRISGLYIRPRPIDRSCRINGINSLVKRWGWRMLDRGDWLRNILVLDEKVAERPRKLLGHTKVRFLPEPNYLCDYSTISRPKARSELGIPEGAIVFLHYGLGTRRKGLHQIISVWKALPADGLAFLLVAGRVDDEFVEDLEALERSGKARLLLRYVNHEDEAAIFAAADIVLVAYVNHYGSSNLLSRAAAAGRPVLASDQGLVGFRVTDNKLGRTFKHNDIISLNKEIQFFMKHHPLQANTSDYGGIYNYARLGSKENLLALNILS